MTAAHRRGVAHEAPRSPRALYIHVPFCVSACPYCDFVVYAGSAARGPRNQLERFLAALEAELELRADALDAAFGCRRAPLTSVYLGGGTPSLLAAAAVGRLLDRLGRRFGIESEAEITLEVNPGSAERGDLAGFRAAGVNRLSIGAQSFDAAELRRLGRRHAPEEICGTVAESRRAGFANLGLDLLYDVPGQTEATWTATLEAALALEPDHVSAYALTLDDPEAEGLAGPAGDHLPVRSGARRWRARAKAEQDDARAAALYRLCDARLEAAGLPWYELSNWARPGRRSRHNLAYWLREPYEALGPGAHSFDGGLLRRWNAARLDGYLAALLPADGSPARLPPGGVDQLTSGDALAEAAILALRLRAGLPQGLSARRELAPALAWGRSGGLLATSRGGGVRLTTAGRLVADEVFVRLLPGERTPQAVAVA